MSDTTESIVRQAVSLPGGSCDMRLGRGPSDVLAESCAWWVAPGWRPSLPPTTSMTSCSVPSRAMPRTPTSSCMCCACRTGLPAARPGPSPRAGSSSLPWASPPTTSSLRWATSTSCRRRPSSRRHGAPGTSLAMGRARRRCRRRGGHLPEGSCHSGHGPDGQPELPHADALLRPRRDGSRPVALHLARPCHLRRLCRG